MPKGLIIANPASGRGRAAQLIPRVMRLCGELGLELDLHETSGPGSGGEAAATAADDISRIIAIGGDGTVNEIVNGLARREGGTIPVALVPMGTSNSAARELGIPFDPEAAAAVAAQGVPRNIDLGITNGRRFFLCTGAGPVAYIVDELHKRRKGAISQFTYMRYGARCAARYPFAGIRVTIDGQPVEAPCQMVTVCNMSHYGHPMKLTPEAEPDDGIMDVCLIRPKHRISYVGLMIAALRHRFGRRKDVEIVRARSISLEAADGSDIPYQIDGDPGGMLPVEIEVLPSAQPFMVPAPAGDDPPQSPQ